MWYLKDKQNKVVRMKNGEPFEYSTEWTARLGARFLAKRRKTRIRVLERPAS